MRQRARYGRCNPVLPDGRILLTEQEQPGKEPLIGATGGRVDEREDVLVATKRELLEEGGYEAEEYILWHAELSVSKMEWAVLDGHNGDVSCTIASTFYMNAFITSDTPVTDATLNAIAHIPTKSIHAVVEKSFFKKLSDEDFCLHFKYVLVVCTHYLYFQTSHAYRHVRRRAPPRMDHRPRRDRSLRPDRE